MKNFSNSILLQVRPSESHAPFFNSFLNRTLLLVLVIFVSGNISSQTIVTSPMEEFGFNIGDDYHLANYTQLENYWKKLEKESPRMVLREIGKTAEGRPQFMAIISSPENLSRLKYYKEISAKLALAGDITDSEAHALAKNGKPVVWIDGGLHATEVCGSHQLMELVYEMVSRNDEETKRLLNDVILLAVLANPDGMELVSNWYMREKDPEKRSTRNIPRLYQKYIGHDNNRDSYMVTQPETENMSRIMYRDWYPQIMYNHHQSGPSDIIIFVPPFRDPVNYYYDPLVVMGIESLGAAMHSRLIAEGLPGSGMRSRANYSVWFNGNLRTTGYFHNQIGLLTEIKGNPTPYKLAFYPDRQLASVDMPFPFTPGVFHFSEAIKYSMALDRAVLDYASRYSETLLYNRYLMGKNNIEKGNKDHWTIKPLQVDQVNEAVRRDKKDSGELAPTFRRRGQGVPYKYFEMLHKPENRDPRGYILPANQPDFPTATKFVNTFIKNGVTVYKASAAFEVNGKNYPAGSYIFKTNQAFRPHVLDLFEPQNYPNDFLYQGGPPIPPYDNAGYTLAYQMGIEFDRILEPFDGPFEKIMEIEHAMPGSVAGKEKAIGYFLSHKVNDATIAVNRLLAERYKVYWLKEEVAVDGLTYPAGTIYIVAKKNTPEVLEKISEDLGLHFTGVSQAPTGKVLLLHKVKIGLWDRYGGSIPSGWTRWILEQYSFPFEVVYPKTLDEGNLNKKFDVLVFVTGAIPGGRSMAYSGTGREASSNIPEMYRNRLGSVTMQKTIPNLLSFIRNGGTVITIGSSTKLGGLAGLPMGNHIVDGKGKPLPREQYYIPSSILQVRVNNRLPIAYGMKERTDVFFNNSPVFRFQPDADKKGLTSVAWFDSDKPLRSGWAWGQDRLYGGVAIATARIGKGNLFLFGPEILFRAQSHGTFKLFFNGIFLSGAEKTSLEE